MIVLTVDDDAEDIEIFLEAIKEINDSIICITAHNGLEALDYLHSDLEPPDFIFLDINMPKMNGKDCLTEIRKNPAFNNIQIIIYSTTNNIAEIKHYENMGARFLKKANSYAELVRALGKILEA
jgi:CheY-like chemotaxis protein